MFNTLYKLYNESAIAEDSMTRLRTFPPITDAEVTGTDQWDESLRHLEPITLQTRRNEEMNLKHEKETSLKNENQYENFAETFNDKCGKSEAETARLTSQMNIRMT